MGRPRSINGAMRTDVVSLPRDIRYRPPQVDTRHPIHHSPGDHAPSPLLVPGFFGYLPAHVDMWRTTALWHDGWPRFTLSDVEKDMGTYNWCLDILTKSTLSTDRMWDHTCKTALPAVQKLLPWPFEPHIAR